MATTYSPLEFKGEHFEEIFNEVLFLNKTVSEKLVRLVDNVKTETAFTEVTATVTPGAFKSTHTSGDINASLALKDYMNRPVLLEVYDEVDPTTLKYSRYGKGASAGTFNMVDDAFWNLLLDEYAPRISLAQEKQFWNGATSATKTSVAALTPGTLQTEVSAAEQTYVAAAPTNLFDGVVTRLIYDRGAVGKRIKVAGTTISSSNIATEYAKLYAAIPAVLVQPENIGKIYIYAPYSHLQLINIFNITATYRDLFSVQGSKYYYNGIEIKFVPIPENTMIVGNYEDFIWTCDMLDETSFLKLDNVANNSIVKFYWMAYTQNTSVMTPSQKVLYQG